MVIYELLPLARLVGWKVRVDYQHYIHSAAWRRRAARVRMRQGYRCKECGRRARLDVHHLTYARLGCERASDLEGLCRPCHNRRHWK